MQLSQRLTSDGLSKAKRDPANLVQPLETTLGQLSLKHGAVSIREFRGACWLPNLIHLEECKLESSHLRSTHNQAGRTTKLDSCKSVICPSADISQLNPIFSRRATNRRYKQILWQRVHQCESAFFARKASAFSAAHLLFWYPSAAPNILKLAGRGTS